MAEQSKMKIESLRRSVEKKLGVTREAFDKVVEAKRGLVKKNSPDLSEADVEKRVFLLVKSEYKKQLMSPAINFEGVVLSWGRTFDSVAQMRADAMEAMKRDEEQAIAEGYVDVDGYPLDTREVYKSGQPNRQYGKRLPKHNYIRNLIGVCIYEEVPRLFRLVLSDVVPVDKPVDPATLKTNLEVPMFVPVEFRANVAKTQRDDRFLQLNQSKSTDFRLSDAEIDIANVMNSELLDPFRVTPEEVGDYYDAHATQPERLVIMEGSVMMIGEEGSASGDVLVMVDSEESGFDFMGVRCWVPSNLLEKADIEEGDVVTIIGQANRGTFGDESVDMVNVTGIYTK